MTLRTDAHTALWLSRCPSPRARWAQDREDTFHLPYNFSLYSVLIFCSLIDEPSSSWVCILTAFHWSLHRVRGSKQMNTVQCARYVYQTEGIRGFYRGLTASYAGISETIICFAIYESLKKYLKEAPLASSTNGTEKNSTSFFGLMAAAAISKGCASCIAYPHGMFCFFFQTVEQLWGLCHRPYTWASAAHSERKSLHVLRWQSTSEAAFCCRLCQRQALKPVQLQHLMARTYCAECRPCVVELRMFSEKPKIWILFKIPRFKKTVWVPTKKKTPQFPLWMECWVRLLC